MKTLFTDLGFENGSQAIQVYGRQGYIREHGIKPYARDTRIAMLYEGTNGIQVLDLVGCKIPSKHISVGGDETGFYAAKGITVQFFVDRILPQTAALFLAIKSDKESMMEMQEMAF